MKIEPTIIDVAKIEARRARRRAFWQRLWYRLVWPFHPNRYQLQRRAENSASMADALEYEIEMATHGFPPYTRGDYVFILERKVHEILGRGSDTDKRIRG